MNTKWTLDTTIYAEKYEEPEDRMDRLFTRSPPSITVKVEVSSWQGGKDAPKRMLGRAATRLSEAVEELTEEFEKKSVDG